MSKDILPNVVYHVANTRTMSGSCRSSTAMIVVLYPNKVRCDKSCHNWLVQGAIGPKRCTLRDLAFALQPLTGLRLRSTQPTNLPAWCASSGH